MVIRMRRVPSIASAGPTQETPVFSRNLARAVLQQPKPSAVRRKEHSMHALRLLLPLILLLSSISGACAAEVPDPELQAFWTRFRQAVLAYDKNKVATMTQFPFEVGEVDDSVPIKHYNRKGFFDIYERLMVQRVSVPSGNVSIEKSMIEFIEDKTEIAPKDLSTENRMRFEQFVFERVRGRWRFTRAYLEE
jgi:hypothetical protein